MKIPIVFRLLISVGCALIHCSLSSAQDSDSRNHLILSFDSSETEEVTFLTKEGNFAYCDGVAGRCLKFDGFTTKLVLPSHTLKSYDQGFTIETWIAPQEYSWGWTGILDQASDSLTGISFGINHAGKVGFVLPSGHRLVEVLSEKPIPLLEWTHIAGTFHPEAGFRVFINGEMAASGNYQFPGDFPSEVPLMVGVSQRKQFPALTERANSRQFLSAFYFDGLIDEVEIHGKTLSEQQINSNYAIRQLKQRKPLTFRKLPSGPDKLDVFGAFYTKLKYCDEWDQMWPAGEFADIVVGFQEIPVRMVFWRGTGYCPAWVSSNGKWVSDQGPESWNWNTVGCFEQMSDKQCRYSNVRIIENTPARVVVHWRTASPGIDYSLNHVDPQTGWAEWTDEYYYIYPDAVAVRYQEIHSTHADEMEWQQSEIINQPGTRPQDNVELQAATIVNMDGEAEHWTWESSYGKRSPGSDSIQNGIIQIINLKSEEKHFVIGEPGAYWKPFTFGALEGFSTIPCWNHWPVAQLPNEGRVAPASDRPSSACVGTLYPVKHKTENPNRMIGRNLYGLTRKPLSEVAALARSWNQPPVISVPGNENASAVYDKSQRAYLIQGNWIGANRKMKILLKGSKESPVINPAFLVKSYGQGIPTVVIGGKVLNPDKDYKTGYVHTMEGVDLLLWIRAESFALFELEIL